MKDIRNKQQTATQYKKSTHASTRTAGFTIVELLIVIVVIAILAVISIVLYNGIQDRAAAATLQSDLRNASTQLGAASPGRYIASEHY